MSSRLHERFWRRQVDGVIVVGFRINFLRACSREEIRRGVFRTLEEYRDLLPGSRTAKILIKPNLNSNMNALTGNTTDLRLIAVVVEFMKESGYGDITIGEGTNSGFYRNDINVIVRLGIDKLAQYYGVQVTDLNFSDKVDIPFEEGVKAGVARECLEADFFINMPKLKTHFEVGMSVCLKNMMGCLVGQENKKKTHRNLARNILNLNKRLKPHLHIVDGLIAMEGLGPTRGTPVHTGTVIVGADPFLVDLVCAKIAGFEYRKVKTLKALEDDGILTGDYHEFVESLDLSVVTRKFEEPKASLLASFIHSPKRQRYFLAVRNTRVFNYLCSTRLVGNLLFWMGLRQDNFIKEEMVFQGLGVDNSRCRPGCSKCADYCPLGLRLPGDLGREDNGCIACLYCYLVCPGQAIEFRGRLGFMAELLSQYGDIITKVT